MNSGTSYKADPYASSGSTEKPFQENLPSPKLGFISTLVRLARLRGFGYGAKPPKPSTVKNPMTMGSHGSIK